MFIFTCQYGVLSIESCFFVCSQALHVRLGGKKTIFHLHAGNFGRFEADAGKLTRKAISWFLGGANATVAVSTAVGEELLNLGANRETLHLIGNTACFAESAVSRQAVKTSECIAMPYVAFAGRLTEAKGLGDLLKAVSLLKERLYFVYVKLAGDGDIYRWKQLANDLGISDRVAFLGWLDEEQKLALYRNAHVFCMPSHYESFGISTLEAMFSRIPIIGTRLGGFLDLVEDGVTGYLIKPSDPEALAERLHEVMRNPERAVAMGKAALARAEQRYSSAAIVGLYVQCYRGVITRSENTNA